MVGYYMGKTVKKKVITMETVLAVTVHFDGGL